MALDLLQHWQIPFAAIHTDFEGAYPSVDHKVLLVCLEWLRIPQDFIDMVRNIYAQAQTKIRTAWGHTMFIRIERGILQGDPLSCLLFICYMEPLLRRPHRELDGWQNPLGATVHPGQLFCDDLQALLFGQ